ncbi:MAG: acylphosphatase [Spirochaetota bacterium]|nr:acylphosphatase [Spirochaetota bacterium]
MPKELTLSGRVQGVFCRHYCSQNAKKLGIRGSASNLRDGTVRVILDCDEEEKIADFIRAIKNNLYGLTFYGHIDDVKVDSYSGIIKGDYTF